MFLNAQVMYFCQATIKEKLQAGGPVPSAFISSKIESVVLIIADII